MGRVKKRLEKGKGDPKRLERRLNKLTKRIERGDDRPNETLRQRRKRLVKRQSANDNDKRAKRIADLDKRIKEKPKMPRVPAKN